MHNSSSSLLSNGHSTYPRQAHHLIEQQQQQPRLPFIPPVLCSPNEPVSFEFGVHLAEGSKMCSVSNFSSMVELYEKIAQCFDISPKEVKEGVGWGEEEEDGKTALVGQNKLKVRLSHTFQTSDNSRKKVFSGCQQHQQSQPTEEGGTLTAAAANSAIKLPLRPDRQADTGLSRVD